MRNFLLQLDEVICRDLPVTIDVENVKNEFTTGPTVGVENTLLQRRYEISDTDTSRLILRGQSVPYYQLVYFLANEMIVVTKHFEEILLKTRFGHFGMQDPFWMVRAECDE